MEPKKIISVITICCFLLVSVFAQGVHAAVEMKRESSAFKQILDDCVIPPAIGRVTRGRYFDGNRLVINIQDLHCHPEVQRNIGRILAILDENCHPGKVYVEGAYGDVDTSWLGSMKDKKLKKEIVETLVDQGRLTGTEYYSINAGKPSLLKGIEDRTIHRENVVRLGKILEKREYFEARLGELERDLEFMKARYFNAGNRRFSRIVAQGEAGKIDTNKYYILLRKYAEKIGGDPERFNSLFAIRMRQYPHISGYMDLTAMSRDLNYRRIARQLQEFVRILKATLSYNAYNYLLQKTDNFSKLDQLYVYLAKIAQEYRLDLNNNFPDLQRFFEYTEKSRNINPLELIREQKRLVEEIRIGLSQDSSELEVSFLADFFAYFRDYLLNRLTADDYGYFVQRFDSFKTIWGKYAARNTLAELAPDFELLDAFYQANCERNRCFLRNMLQGQENSAGNAAEAARANDGEDPGAADSISRALGCLATATEVTVVVAGGFHTEGIEKLLEERKISYLAITPNVTQGTATADAVYVQLAREQAKILANALALGLASQLSSPEMFALALEAARAGLKGIPFTEANIRNLVEELERSVGVEGVSLAFDRDKAEAVVTFPGGRKIVLSKDDAGGVKLPAERAAFVPLQSQLSGAVKTAVTELLRTAGGADGLAGLASVLPDTYGTLKRLFSFAARQKLVTGYGLIFPLNGRESIDGVPASLVANMPERIQEMLLEHERRNGGALGSEWARILIVVGLGDLAASLRPRRREGAGAADTAGLIGKYRVLTTPVFFPEAGELRFQGRDMETGEEKEIILSNARTYDGEALSGIPRFTNDAVDAVLDWFDEDFDGELLVFGENDYGIDGIGTTCVINGVERSIIGLSDKVKNEWIAWFHEIAELMGVRGKLDAETIIAGLRDRSWYDAHIAKAGRDASRLHYAIRALQREAFSHYDADLTYMVKGRLSSVEIGKIIRSNGSQSLSVAIRKEFKLRRAALQTRDQEVRLLLEIVRQEEERERQRRREKAREEKKREEEERKRNEQRSRIQLILEDARKRVAATRVMNYEDINAIAFDSFLALSRHDDRLVAEVVARTIAEHAEADRFTHLPEHRFYSFLVNNLFTNLSKNAAGLAVQELLKDMRRGRDKRALGESVAAVLKNYNYYSFEQFEAIAGDLAALAGEAFARRPFVQRYQVEDMGREVVENYFDPAPGDPRILYFKDDFLRQLFKIRDVGKIERLQRMHNEAFLDQNVVMRIVSAAMRRDKDARIFRRFLGLMVRGDGSDYARGEIASMLAAECDTVVVDKDALFASLSERIIALYRQTADDRLRRSLTLSLLVLSGETTSAAEQRKIAEFVQSIDTPLFEEVTRTGELLRNADREYAAAKKEAAAADLAEEAGRKVLEIRKAQAKLMEEMQRHMAILFSLAKSSYEEAGQNATLEALLEYLVQVASNDTWDGDIRAEAASQLKYFVTRRVPSAVQFILGQAAPRLSVHDRNRLAQLLVSGTSEKHLRTLLKDNAPGLPGRTAYLLLLAAAENKNLLETVIADEAVDARLRIYAFCLYASRHLSYKAWSAAGEVNYNDDQMRAMTASLTGAAEKVLREVAEDGGPVSRLFYERALQDEEMTVYGMAALINVQQRLGLTKAKGFAKAAGIISGARIRQYLDNANSRFVFGGRILQRVEEKRRGTFFVQIVAHELMHVILEEEFGYLPFDLTQGIVHEFLADLLAHDFSDAFDLDYRVIAGALNFEKDHACVQQDDYHTVECHEGARAQETIIENAVAAKGLSFDAGRFVQAGLAVVAGSEYRYAQLAGIISAMLSEYFGDRGWANQPQDSSGDAHFVKMLMGQKNTFDPRQVKQKVLEPGVVLDIIGGALRLAAGDPVMVADAAVTLSGTQEGKKEVRKALNVFQTFNDRLKAKGWSRLGFREKLLFIVTHPLGLGPLVGETGLLLGASALAKGLFGVAMFDPTGISLATAAAVAAIGLAFSLAHPDLYERGIGRKERGIRFASRFAGGMLLTLPFAGLGMAAGAVASAGLHFALNFLIGRRQLPGRVLSMSGRERFEIGNEYYERGHRINGGISRGRSGGREIILVDIERDKDLKDFCEMVIRESGIRQADKRTAYQKGNLVETVFKALQKHIRYDDQWIERVEREYHDKEVLVGKIAIAPGKAVCRHMGIIAATILEQCISEGLLQGEAYYVRGSGHGWAVYRTSGGEHYVLDVAQSQFGPMAKLQYWTGNMYIPYAVHFPPRALNRPLNPAKYQTLLPTTNEEKKAAFEDLGAKMATALAELNVQGARELLADMAGIVAGLKDDEEYHGYVEKFKKLGPKVFAAAQFVQLKEAFEKAIDAGDLAPARESLEAMQNIKADLAEQFRKLQKRRIFSCSSRLSAC